MPSWTELDLFLTNTFKELVSADDVPESIPDTYTHPKSKHVQENKNNVNRKGNTLHTMVHFENNLQCEEQYLKSTQNYPKPHQRICVLCDSDHALKECSSFNSLGINERIDFVKENAICYNCLAVNHQIENCASTYTCRYCGGPHNTLLHNPSSNPNPTFDDNPPNVLQSFSTFTRSKTPVLDDRTKLLGTAVIQVEAQGRLFPARALIDPASDYSFISDQFRRRLRLPTLPISAEISGLNEVVSARSNQMCEVTLRSNTQKDFSLKIQSIVVKTLTQNLPTQNINPNIIENIHNVALADPRFYESKPIDLIIGSDFYPQIIKSGIKNNVLNTLLAQDTQFGWILTGPIEESHRTRTQPTTQKLSCFSTVTQINCITQKPKKYVKESRKDIQKIRKNIPDERYRIDLPFPASNLELQNSKNIYKPNYEVERR